MRDDIAEWLALANSPELGSVGIRRLRPLSITIRSRRRRPDRARSRKRHPSFGSCVSRCSARILLRPQGRHCYGRGLRLPRLLLETFSPPPLLYIKGDYRILERPSVALVGARNSSHYGRHVARSFAEELARKGVCVVSGMALGIDACSHEGELRGGTTAALLGTGLDHPYPVSNLALFHQICEKGAVVSEFPMGTTAAPKHFPRRNRTISGLSQALSSLRAVPEAARSSRPSMP